MADDFAIEVPDIGKRPTRINTEYLYLKAQSKAMDAAMMKYHLLEPYKIAVEQMEILAEGSGLLDEEYLEKKEEIREKIKKAIGKISENYKPGLRKSVKNDQISKQVENTEVQFITMWHRLLMKTLAPLFYEETEEEEI
tara:strand:- start:1495 stop:1911 length:417 start_codon:yes stop_codon:yes gene_type:complete